MWATIGLSCPPVTRYSAPLSGSSCSRGSPRPSRWVSHRLYGLRPRRLDAPEWRAEVSIRRMIRKLVQWRKPEVDDAPGCSSITRERPDRPEAMDVTAIKSLVEQGRYEVDSQLVADAIISRMFGRSEFGSRRRGDQNSCSKPASSPSPSR